MPDALKVLIVVHNQTGKGGAYFRARNLAKPLVRRGHDVTIMSISPRERLRTNEIALEGFTVVESPDLLWGKGRTGWDPWDTLRRIAWLADKRFDIVHTVDTRPAVSIPALFAQRARGAKWVADWTDWWGRGGATEERPGWTVRVLVGPLEEFFEERPRPLADGTIAISQALARRAQGLGIDPRSMLVLPPGADPGDLRDTSIEEARARVGLDRGGRYVGYLGNIYPRDAAMLLEALARLEEKDAKLVMVGDAEVPVDPAVAGRVIRTGRVPFGKMLDYLSACDVLALPLSDTIANRGRWPSKINEYVCVGRPTVACDVGDIASFLRDEGAGLVVEPSAAGLADGLGALLRDPGRARAIGERAREVARTTYSQEAVGRKLEAFYVQTLAGHPRA
jgi:glycosyltransferase involved in cell wall biosynthesis